MFDTLADITGQLHQEFPTVSLGEVFAMVRRCRADIDIGAPADCIPELVDRIARVRLAELVST